MKQLNNMDWLAVVIILSCICETVKGIAQRCSYCRCCIGKFCEQGGTCTHGCIDGMLGNKCNYECPSNCKACTRNPIWTGSRLVYHCTKCPDGRYIDSQTKDCSLQCPHRCKTCVSFTNCIECHSTYYNMGSVTDCSMTCPVNCKVCNSPGICSICKDGYFNPTSGCTDDCPAKCSTCTSSNDCKYCKPGFYSSREGDRINSIEHSDCRFACRPSCTTCSSYNNCSSCKIGKFGVSCQGSCSAGCQLTSCHRDTGSCTCKNGFTGNQCDMCERGKYGELCNKNCSNLCKDSNCLWSSGQCLECITNYFSVSDKTCSTCINGMHGIYCNQTCPANCKDGICYRFYGPCSNGCNPNFSGLLCDSCVKGKYGPDCTLDCSTNCYGGQCKRQTGNCLSCKSNSEGERCNDCKTGLYTEDCSEVCKSSSCKNNICHKTNGTCAECPKGMYGNFCNQTCSKGCVDYICGLKDGACTLGCQETFYGDKCCTKNGNCEICSSNEECSACLPGYYGDNCEAKCSENCKDDCNKTSGECESCKLGMHGKLCDSNCSATCEQKVATSSCDAKSGHCLFGCQVGYHGQTCESSCHSNCVGSKCHQDGQCSIGCVDGYEGKTCSQAAAKTASSIVGPAMGGGAGFVVLIISGILVGFFFMRKRRMKLRSCRGAKKDKTSFDVSGEENNYFYVAEVERPEPLYSEPNKTKKEKLCKEQYCNNDNENENPPRDVLVETYDETVEQNGQDECYCNMTTNIKVTALFNYVMKKTKDSFKLEFSVPTTKKLQKPCSFAKRPENVEKNRYNGIYPYDHSRVQVMGDPTFFINANYIDGFEKERMYIASLGPTKETTGDFKIFWEMVWHEKADVIVMLTNLRELTGMKCEQYWPELNESIQFGDVTVSCNNVDNFAEYTARVFTVSKMTETRSLTHLHYTAWPDKDVPDNVTSLVEFRQRVNATPRSTTGPIIVHCSAGVGRTGTYIALDRLAEEGEYTASVNVYGCILSMREQRMNMVQTLGQYEFLHKALVHSLTFDCKPIPAEAFVGHVGSMTDASYENQFQHLKQNIEEDSTEEQEAVIANSSRLDKNRKGADIPGNRYRQRLYLNRTYNESDYINATNIDSFKKKNHFIIAQTPLPTTVLDFLTLAYQENCSCIVSMGNVADTEMDVGTYLPSDKQSLSKGCFTVTCLKSETSSQYIQTILTIKNTGKQEAGEKTLCHFEYKGWKTGARVPGDAGDFVQFVKDVTFKANTPNEVSSPILVHCLNGVERSGLFCAVAVLLEKIQLEYRISIVNTLRQIMKRKTSAFGNKEQLEFCYNCLAAHLESNNIYANLVL